MRTLLNLGDGALVITEEGGDVTLAVSKTEAVGGGKAADILEAEGSGKIVFKSGTVGLKLAVAFVEAHSPAAIVPFEEEAAVLAEAAVAKL